MRGRKPKPTRLKEVAGNPGKRKLNQREPRPYGLPQCPAWLDAEAKKEWKRLLPELERLGLVTMADQAALVCYCQSYSQLRSAEKLLQQEGLTVTEEGKVKEHPAGKIADKAKRQIRAFASEFGLTPSSRGRLQVPGGEDGPDPLKVFLDDAG